MAYLVLKNNDIDTFYMYNLYIKTYSDNLVKFRKTSIDMIESINRGVTTNI